jgi:methylenetetrahydrofolate dehydrogenase (NADP+)/methenyltetrahydrofolate cyclohydrolase
VVIGRSNIVGKPMAQLLLGENCTVTIAHSRTRDLPASCAAPTSSSPRSAGPRWSGRLAEAGRDRDRRRHQPGRRRGTGRLVGDVDFDEASEVAGAITPVPGGVGPMTIACLLRNTLVAASPRRPAAAGGPVIELFVSAFVTCWWSSIRPAARRSSPA